MPPERAQVSPGYSWFFLYMSECGTWSHAVISSLGARARGGLVGRLRSVSHVVRPRQGSRFDGLGWARYAPSGHVRVLYGPIWVHISGRTLIRDSRVIRQGSSGPVPSSHIGFRRVSIGTLFWHDGTRLGVSHIGV